MNEPERSAFVLTIFYMAELVCPNFYGPVILDGVHLETALDELPLHLVILCKQTLEIFHRLLIPSQTFVVLVELEVFRKQGFEFVISCVLNALDSALSICWISSYSACEAGAASGGGVSLLATGSSPESPMAASPTVMTGISFILLSLLNHAESILVRERKPNA